MTAKTTNVPVSCVYKLIIATEFTICKNFTNVNCFTVIGFNVTDFKLGVYSLMMALLCRNME